MSGSAYDQYGNNRACWTPFGCFLKSSDFGKGMRCEKTVRSCKSQGSWWHGGDGWKHTLLKADYVTD